MGNTFSSENQSYKLDDNSAIVAGIINFKNCLLDSNGTCTLGVKKNISFISTVVAAKTLHICTDSSSFLCKAILFTFNPKKTSLPSVIHGKIDFENNTTEGSFIAYGANKVEIEFAQE